MKSSPSPGDIFQRVYDAFGAAKQPHGKTFYYKIAGQLISLDFANSELIPLVTPALMHLLQDTSVGSDLEVHIWDSTTTGVPLPRLPWSEGSYPTSFGELDYQDGRVHYRDEQYEFYYCLGVDLFMLDEKNGQAIVWMEDAADYEYHETAAPMRTVLQWWLSRHGGQLVHGAAVGQENGGVLMAAKGGSGKSTSALTCLGAGMQFAGDDYVAISNSPEPYVHGLFCSAKIHANNLHRVPHLQDAVQNRDKLDYQKGLLLLNDQFSGQMSRGFPLKALLVPRITPQIDTSLTPASATVGLAALAPTTMFQLPGSNKTEFQTMVKLVKSLPCYWLELGTDVAQIPRTISRFLND